MKQIDIFKITTPVYGTVDIKATDLIIELQQRLRQAKEENKHFGWGCTRYTITMDNEGQLWLSGWVKSKRDE